MYSVDIQIESPRGSGEVLPSDLKTVELLVEDVVSRALLELFGMVLVRGVKVGFCPSVEEGEGE